MAHPYIVSDSINTTKIWKSRLGLNYFNAIFWKHSLKSSPSTMSVTEQNVLKKKNEKIHANKKEYTYKTRFFMPIWAKLILIKVMNTEVEKCELLRFICKTELVCDDLWLCPTVSISLAILNKYSISCNFAHPTLFPRKLKTLSQITKRYKGFHVASWWCTPFIPALGRQNQEDLLWVGSLPGPAVFPGIH